MNRQTRRLMEREERRNKKQKDQGGQRGRTPASRPQTEKKSLFERLTTFFHDVRQEMKRVSWPTQEQLIAFTTVTLITTIVLTLVVFGLDVAMKETVLFVVDRS